MWKKKNNTAIVQSTGIEVTLDELVALRHKVFNQALSSHKQQSAFFSGQNLAKVRGRGIEFDTTREYQAGDDVRRMAWRVTARSLKPHIKVYQEERERPIWLGLDLSPSLYFGTRQMFKSARSIIQAGFLGWSGLNKRERIGALIGTSQHISVYTPKAREQDFLQLLKSLSHYSAQLPSFTDNNCLHVLLTHIDQYVRSGHSLYILSDFMQFDAFNKKLILHIAQRAQVKLIFIYDMFESVAPPIYQYRVTNGQETVLFNMINAKAQEEYQNQFQRKLKELIQFSRQNCLAFETLRTDQEQPMKPHDE